MQIALSHQPESTRQLLARSLTLYQATFLKVFLLGLIVSIVVFIPRILSLIIGKNLLITLPLTSPYRLFFMLIDLISLIFFTAILWRMQCKSVHTRDTIFKDIKMALKKLPFIFVASLIQSFIIVFVSFSIFGFVLFLQQKNMAVPGFFTMLFFSCLCLLQFAIAIFLFVEFYFYLPIILTENQRIFSALNRSVHLVWGNWWRTFRLQITPWIIYLLVLIIIRNFFHVNIHIYFVQLPEKFTWLATSIHIFIFALFIPWVAANILVQLHDLELRKKMLPTL